MIALVLGVVVGACAVLVAGCCLAAGRASEAERRRALTDKLPPMPYARPYERPSWNVEHRLDGSWTVEAASPAQAVELLISVVAR